MDDNRKVIVRLENFGKSYKDKVIIKNINLDVYEGEFLTILGSSGCGKTTILRAISGLDEPTTGKIFLDGVDVTNLPPQKRHVNTIFQNYALFPLMTIKENISFGLKMKKISQIEIDKKVDNVLKLVHLKGYEDRKPKELSGGEQQRVSIARGIVNNPKVLLLDEPISALDLKLRKKMHIELKQLQRKLGITFIYVTHDQDEALSMSDRIVVLKDGYIEQIGTPEEVYEKPKSLFVADFLGEANIFKGTVIDENLASISEHINIAISEDYEIDSKINIIIRPENVILNKDKVHNSDLFGKITHEEYDGSYTKMLVTVDNFDIKVVTFGNDKLFKLNDEVYLYWNIDDQIVLGSDKYEKK